MLDNVLQQKPRKRCRKDAERQQPPYRKGHRTIKKADFHPKTRENHRLWEGRALATTNNPQPP
ncbi:hypothetical protein A2U01_0100715 [Trifolium medium]|uniref:Uncharacterized protein n=1 Tax=Trifolium medium TaxID=97028 RepID=A0A392UTU3_9FABA|nr:hypothetical protein [Trifolium medium]